MDDELSCNPLKRVRYFAGQLITAEDMAEEQHYFRERVRRHNRLIHGCGVVAGLEISIKHKLVKVSPGMALDCTGNEVTLCKAFEAHEPKDGEVLFITISYHEEETDPVPATDAPGSLQASRFEESCEVKFEDEDPCSDHETKKRWPACGRSHGITLARIVRRHGKWKVDRDYRRPRVSV
jgi:hypothetical protein